MNNITAYHAKFFAYELTRQLPANEIGKLTASLQDAQVDLNPHQVEASLFAFQSPLSNGAILADEVGLGKTIEAGIILSQQWAERKRRLLIICPANLRKQWNQELLDKFFLPSVILESKSFNQYIKEGNPNPFNVNGAIVICSFQFARTKEFYVQQTAWDLVIIDEAHRLRNVYKPSNRIGNTLKNILSNRKKILLTATPLQNSILELYGLVSIIDDYVFGDLKSFKSRFNHQLDEDDYTELKGRLSPVCKRTLRRQVLEYINYTERKAICQEFFPTDLEQQLYDAVSEYLRRPKLYALPNSQRQLMTLILRKLLASSTYAIYGTFETMIARLEALIATHTEKSLDEIELDFETFEEIEDEWKEEEDEILNNNGVFLQEDITAIKAEIEELKRFRDLAENIQKNSKAEQLFAALDEAFEQLKILGANQKALIFTESRRTQDFLLGLLETRGYKGKVVLFNGVNNDAKSGEIYRAWLNEHKGTDKITGSTTADKRAALVDYFKNEATIMIATEAAAEGINLQFCSLVVNYDLPWNPQRIEQRIGRCHRYGQKHDVVVVNFLNKANAADIRVYQLLDQKFQLFNGVFGASDEVLGAIGNGVDFEKRIAQIYNECRNPEEIQSAFDELQEELKSEISDRIRKVRSTLLENFDEEVREKLKIDYKKSREYLTVYEEKLWKTTRFYLQDYADFSDTEYSFTLKENPFPNENIHSGPYMILKAEEGKRKSEVFVPDDTNIYRSGHKLAQKILNECKNANTPCVEVSFDYTNTQTKISLLEPFIGKSGWLKVEQLSIQSFETEDCLLVACISDDNQIIEPEIAQRLFSLYANTQALCEILATQQERVAKELIILQEKVVNGNMERNRDFFDTEMDKLEQWADDMKISLEKEIKDLDAEIKLRKSEAKKVLNLEEKVQLQRQIKEMEKKRAQKRQTLFSAQDEIDDKKEILLTDIEKRLRQSIEKTELFTIRWNII
jgi:superfamily II DNA/RNA helicase